MIASNIVHATKEKRSDCICAFTLYRDEQEKKKHNEKVAARQRQKEEDKVQKLQDTSSPLHDGFANIHIE